MEANSIIAGEVLHRRPSRGLEAIPDPSGDELRRTIGAAAARPPMRCSRESRVRRLLVLTDVVALTLAFALVEAFGGFRGDQHHGLVGDLALLAIGIPVWVLFAHAHNLYHADSRRADHGAAEELMPVVQMATAWSWSTLLLCTVSGVRSVSVGSVALFWVATIVLLLVLRTAARVWARGQVWYLQTALAVGPAEEAVSLVRKFMRHPEYGIHLMACIDTAAAPSPGKADDSFIGPVPIVRGGVDLSELVEQLDADRVIFTAGAPEAARGSESLCALADLDVHIDLIPSWSDVVGRRLDFHELEGMSLCTVPRTVARRSDLRLKRAFDFIVSGLGLMALTPLLVACAIAIKLDSSGPVLFRQRRVGRNDRRFEVLKFRSMEVGADARKEEISELNLHGGGTLDGMFKAREDPRVTRVGRWLRRTSLDELPQLINVLKGDMSLVGPRPLIETEDRQVEGRFRRRLASSPGITGPWQIHGRSEIPFEEMISLDYLYVTNWSLWGDIKLLLRTASALVRGQGAY